MPNPKDPLKLKFYKKKQSEIAKAKGYGLWMKGKKHSLETIAKLKEKQSEIGNDLEERKRRSERAKRLGYGKWMKGRKDTPFLLGQKRQALERKGKNWEVFYGVKKAKELKKIAKIAQRKRFDDKVLKNDLRPKHNGDYKYIEWRIAVFTRDNYICQVCFIRGGYLEAHHKKMWSKYPKLRFVVSNGITVHKGKCHRLKDKESRQLEVKRR